MTRTSLLSCRLSRTALLVLLATGTVGATAVLTACSGADQPDLVGGPRRSARNPKPGTDSTGSDTATGGDSSETGGASGSPDNTSASNPGSSTPNPGSGEQNPGTPSTPAAPAADFDLNLATSTATVNMQAETTLQVTIAPKNLTGDVDLTVTGLPTGATATFSQPKVAVSGTTGATSVLTIKSGSAAPGNMALKIVGKSGALTKEAAATVKVDAKLVIKIPQNANTNIKNFSDINITKGAESVTVEWENPTGDTVQIHRQNNGAGMTHGGNIQPGAKETRTITATGNFVFYVHDGADQNQPGRLIVQ